MICYCRFMENCNCRYKTQ